MLNHHKTAKAIEVRQGHILADAQRQRQPFHLPVITQEGHPLPHSIFWVAQIDALPIDLHSSAMDRLNPKEGPRQFPLAMSFQTGQTQNFTCLELEVDVSQSVIGQAVDFQQRCPTLRL